MKFIVRWLFRLALLLVVIAIALISLKDLLAREIIESLIARATGLECRVSNAEIRLFSPTLLLADLRIYHPASLGGMPMVRVAEALLEYDTTAIPKLQIRFRLIRLDVQELTLVEQKSSGSTLEVLKKMWADMPTRISSGWVRFGGVDTLNLNIDRVTFMRLAVPGPPQHLELRLRNQLFRDLATPSDFQAALEQVLTPVVMQIATNPPPKTGKRPY